MTIRDWPDWLSQPQVDATPWLVGPRAGANITVAEIETGGFASVAIILVDPETGDDQEYTVASIIGQTGDESSPAELQTSVLRLVQNYGQTLFVPATVHGTRLRVRMEASTGALWTSTGALVMTSTIGPLSGYGGGAGVVIGELAIPAATAHVFRLPQVTPGSHTVAIDTTATAWTLDLRTWYFQSSSQDNRITDSTVTTVGPTSFLAPATGWDLIFTNGDGVAQDATLTVIRSPY